MKTRKRLLSDYPFLLTHKNSSLAYEIPLDIPLTSGVLGSFLNKMQNGEIPSFNKCEELKPYKIS